MTIMNILTIALVALPSSTNALLSPNTNTPTQVIVRTRNNVRINHAFRTKSNYNRKSNSNNDILFAKQQDNQEDGQEPNNKSFNNTNNNIIGIDTDQVVNVNVNANTNTGTGSSTSSKRSEAMKVFKKASKKTYSNAMQSIQSFKSNIAKDGDTTISNTNTNTKLNTTLNIQDIDKEKTILLGTEILLLLCIINGHVPLLKHLMEFILGPVFLISGIVVTGFAIQEMNHHKSSSSLHSFMSLFLKPSSSSALASLFSSSSSSSSQSSSSSSSSFTPLTQPIPIKKGGKMITTGIYSYIRHPIYAGNILSFIGLSIMTKSAIRLFLTYIYYNLITLKVNKEETNMKKEFGGATFYLYKERVKGKFIPSKDRIVDKLESMGYKLRSDDNDDEFNLKKFLFS